MSNRKVVKPPSDAQPPAAPPPAAATASTNKNSVSLDGDDLNLPKRPWNANLKAYTKQEPSVPWYKRQSRTPAWVTDPPPVKEPLPAVFKPANSNRHSTGRLTKLRAGKASNHTKQIKLHDIRNSNLFRKISVNEEDGEAYEWSIHATISPKNSARNSANLTGEDFTLSEENGNPNNHVEESKGSYTNINEVDNVISPASKAGTHTNVGSIYTSDKVAEMVAAKPVEPMNTIDLSPVKLPHETQPKQQEKDEEKPGDEKKSMFNTLKNMIRRPSNTKLVVEEELRRQFEEEERQLHGPPNDGNGHGSRNEHSHLKTNPAAVIVLNLEDELEQSSRSLNAAESKTIDEMSPIRKTQEDDVNLSREPSVYEASFVIDEDAAYSSQILATEDVEFNLGSVYDDEQLGKSEKKTSSKAPALAQSGSPMKFTHMNTLVKPSQEKETSKSDDITTSLDEIYDELSQGQKGKPTPPASVPHRDANNSTIMDVSDSTIDGLSPISKLTSDLKENMSIHQLAESQESSSLDMGNLYEPKSFEARKVSSSDSNGHNVEDVSPIKFSQMNEFVWKSPDTPGDGSPQPSAATAAGASDANPVAKPERRRSLSRGLSLKNIFTYNTDANAPAEASGENPNPKPKERQRSLSSGLSLKKMFTYGSEAKSAESLDGEAAVTDQSAKPRSFSRGSTLKSMFSFSSAEVVDSPQSTSTDETTTSKAKAERKRSVSRGASLRNLFSSAPAEPSPVSVLSNDEQEIGEHNPLFSKLTHSSSIYMGDIYSPEPEDGSSPGKNPPPTTASDYFAPKKSPLKKPRKSLLGSTKDDVKPSKQANENYENGTMNKEKDKLAKEIEKSSQRLKRPESVKLDLGQVYEEDIQIDGDLIDSDVAASLAHNRVTGELSPLKFAQANEFREELRSRASTTASASDVPVSSIAAFITKTLLATRSQSEPENAQLKKERGKIDSNPEKFTFDMNDLKSEISRSRAGSNTSNQSSLTRRSLSSSPSMEPRSKGSLSIDSVSRSMVSNRAFLEDDKTTVRKFKRSSMPPIPTSSSSGINNADLTSKFDLIKECMICHSDLSRLSLHEHIRHIYGCAETCQSSLTAALAHRNYHPIDPGISLPQEHITTLEMNRPQPLVVTMKRESSIDSSGSAFGTPFGTPLQTPKGSMRAIKVTMDTGTQTTGAFVDDSLIFDGYPSTPRTPLNPIVEQHKQKLTRDITSKVNKINEHRTQLQTQLASNDDDIDLFNVYNKVPEEIYPKPSMALQEDKAARLREEKSKRFNLVGPSLSMDPDVDDKELNKMRQELTELLAKQSEFRVKERILRNVIKKNLAKAKIDAIDALPEDEEEDEDESSEQAVTVNEDGTPGPPPVKSPRGTKTPRSSKRKDGKTEASAEKKEDTDKASAAAEKPPEVVVPEIEVPDHLKKYDLMLKRGVPVAAVAAKMTMEGVSNEDQQVVMKTLEPPKPPEADLPEHLKKYQLMLKRGVPIPGVIAKMNMDKIPPEEQKLVLKGPDEPAAPPAEVELPEHLKKYQLMLKRGVPPPAVIAKMNLEGISAEDQKLVMKSLDTPGNNALLKKKDSDASASSIEVNVGPKLVGLFWDVIEKEKVEASEKNVWKTILATKPPPKLHDAEWETLVSMFSKKEAGKKKSEEISPTAKDSKAATTRKVLDFARSVSISIVLSVFKSRNMEVDLVSLLLPLY
jgi:hypothetical protein